MPYAKKILFIWDFHGTLEKGNVRAVQELVNRVGSIYKINNKITIAQTAELYGLSWIDYFRFIHPQGNIFIWNEMKQNAEKTQLKHKIVEQYIKPQSYARYVLKKIKQKGHSNIIISNSNPKWLKYSVKLIKLNNFIDEIIGLDIHHVELEDTDVIEEKVKAINKYLHHKKYDKIIKIGDRESDIVVGQKIGAVTYFFRNMINVNQKLEIRPDFEIKDLRKLFKGL